MDDGGPIGGKHGAGEYNEQLSKIARANRLQTLTGSTVNLENDQYLMRNQNGLLECKLCCTTHKTEASYLNHTYGKTHQRNLERRRITLARKEAIAGGIRSGTQVKVDPAKNTLKIGDPSFEVIKKRDLTTGNLTILVELGYPDIKKYSSPKYRIMSTYEQTVEPPDPNHKYLLFAAIPYNTVCFKIPNMNIINDKIIEDWKPHEKKYTFQLTLTPNIDQ